MLTITCERCSHTWNTRTKQKPKTCPACRSPFFDKKITPYWKTVRENNKLKKEAQNKVEK